MRKRALLPLIISFLFIIIILGSFDTESKNFEYKINYCKNNAFDLEEMIKTQGINNISVQQDYVNFSAMLIPYCNANQNNFRLDYKRSENDLQVIAIFNDITATKCVCPVEISGIIYDLEKGRYTLSLIFWNKYTKTKNYIDKVEFEIK